MDETTGLPAFLQAKVMGRSTMTAPAILQMLQKEKLLPNSTTKQAYIARVLSSMPLVFECVTPGRYRVRPEGVRKRHGQMARTFHANALKRTRDPHPQLRELLGIEDDAEREAFKTRLLQTLRPDVPV